MSDITVINDSQQSDLVTNGLAKNGELYLKASGSTNAGAIVVYDNGSWRTFANEASAGFLNTYSVSFDGTNDYMSAEIDGRSSAGVLASSDTDIELTISFWFKPNGGGIFAWQNIYNSTTPTILFTPKSSSGTSYEIYYDGAYRHVFSSSEIVVNSWNHFMMTRTASNNTWQIFCNGNSTPVHTYVQTGSLTGRSTMERMFFSTEYYGFGQNIFDEIAFWNSDQSSNLSTIYNSGAPSDISSLSPYGWWRMGDDDGGTGTTITDQGSGGNDGTLVNGPTFSTDVPS